MRLILVANAGSIMSKPDDIELIEVADPHGIGAPILHQVYEDVPGIPQPASLPDGDGD